MIDRSLVEKIEELAIQAAGIKEVGDRPYSYKNLSPVMEPTPAPVTAHTLTAIKDYLTANPDKLDLAEVVVQVINPVCVQVLSKLVGKFQQRNTYLAVEVSADDYPFGRFMSLEEFIIALQSRFTQTAIVKNLLKIVGNLTDGTVARFQDDGVTQTVNTRAGVQRGARTDLPPSLELAPYRTFPEVDQPASLFILRMRSGQDSPLCGLFEADGGAWRLKAIENIKEWLKRELPKDMIILA